MKELVSINIPTYNSEKITNILVQVESNALARRSRADVYVDRFGDDLFEMKLEIFLDDLDREEVNEKEEKDRDVGHAKRRDAIQRDIFRLEL